MNVSLKGKANRWGSIGLTYNTRANAQQLLYIEKARYRYYDPYASEIILFLSQNAHSIVTYPRAQIEKHPIFTKGENDHTNFIKMKRRDLKRREITNWLIINMMLERQICRIRIINHILLSIYILNAKKRSTLHDISELSTPILM